MIEIRQLLAKVLHSAALPEEACAAALGLSREHFAEVLAGQRHLPESYVPLVSALLGVNPTALLASGKNLRDDDLVPAIWFKLRGANLDAADREYVLAIRELAFYQHELEQVTDSRSVGWKALFEDLRRNTDPQAAPTEQGRQAARLFRQSTGLEQGATGIGEVFRGHLRNIGVLVLETAVPDSSLEGCSFYVGPSGSERPCVVANLYKSTWFRRNRVLMHEVAHAIFDVESAIASLDFTTATGQPDVQEQRADAFAQECLVPWETLRHWSQQTGVRLGALEANTLADLMAATHVEQRLLVKALSDAAAIDPAAIERLNGLDVSSKLADVSEHALSTREFVRSLKAAPPAWLNKRSTTEAPRKLLLPVRYVDSVLKAFTGGVISRGKAARMLMVDEAEFADRFLSEDGAAAEI
jgi:Zn-dependent peptidase ImmA (M78 family)